MLCTQGPGGLGPGGGSGGGGRAGCSRKERAGPRRVRASGRGHEPVLRVPGDPPGGGLTPLAEAGVRALVGRLSAARCLHSPSWTQEDQGGASSCCIGGPQGHPLSPAHLSPAETQREATACLALWRDPGHIRPSVRPVRQAPQPHASTRLFLLCLLGRHCGNTGFSATSFCHVLLPADQRGRCELLASPGPAGSLVKPGAFARSGLLCPQKPLPPAGPVPPGGEFHSEPWRQVHSRLPGGLPGSPPLRPRWLCPVLRSCSHGTGAWQSEPRHMGRAGSPLGGKLPPTAGPPRLGFQGGRPGSVGLRAAWEGEGPKFYFVCCFASICLVL